MEKKGVARVYVIRTVTATFSDVQNISGLRRIVTSRKNVMFFFFSI